MVYPVGRTVARSTILGGAKLNFGRQNPYDRPVHTGQGQPTGFSLTDVQMPAPLIGVSL